MGSSYATMSPSSVPCPPAVANDMVFIYSNTYDSNRGVSTVTSTGMTFTKLTTNTDSYLRCWWGVIPDSDARSFSLTWQSGGNGNTVGAYVFRNVNTSTPLDSGVISATGTGYITTGSATTSKPHGLYVMFYAYREYSSVFPEPVDTTIPVIDERSNAYGAWCYTAYEMGNSTFKGGLAFQAGSGGPASPPTQHVGFVLNQI